LWLLRLPLLRLLNPRLLLRLPMPQLLQPPPPQRHQLQLQYQKMMRHESVVIHD
jgi:hypothetical protein